ncbi:MAG: UDP-N-acetylmuramate dehydrogenase [Humidesulfovibrio sp.]|uniref:UDP-N-acetylmuramate dehydrogenase n=1 Tax=Humidesulfovibrio sp. TaxID=2910988 RepID=UPI00273426C2|nr:UDP-N-acetylmuramate dehydrogenase [Humidesulfovibrio sp.]MDP2847469.1 UDP-N-acetylmuramate dehydrogenase [Humidesulfovibrio sp.]
MTLALIHTPRLCERTTLRLGGPALAEAVVFAEADLDQLGKELSCLGGRPLALGAGSNLLAADGPSDLVLVRPVNNAVPQVVQTGNSALVRVGAGFGLPRLLGLCQRLGLSGLEGLTGIPGKVGGAVAMNAGSYGVETGSLLTRVRLWTPEGGLIWREAKDCAFGYRHFDAGLGSGFSVIWEAEFLLASDAPGAIRARMEATYAKKKAVQPVTARSAGCVFKNPAGLPAGAGKLLDEAGMRGRVLGGMAFSSLHANFLVNLGGGTAAQALELLDLGRSAVRARFGVELETEVVVVS